MRKVFVLGGLATLAVTASAQYIIDDGVGENSVGFNNAFQNSIGWLNHFTVSGGNSVITGIQVAFGFGATPFPNGSPVDVFLWNDPNGDGNPGDATVLASLAGVVGNSGTDTFNNYDIADTFVGADGTSFFVGAIVTGTLTTGGFFPARIDQTTPTTGESWITGNAGTAAAPGAAVDPNNLGGTGTGLLNMTALAGSGLDGDWMIRATGQPVPEPATLAVLALGAAAMLRRRKA